MPTPSALSQLSPASAHWAARLHGLAERMAPWAGDWPQKDVLPYVSGLQLVLGGLVLAVTAALIFLARSYTRRAIARARASEGPGAPAPKVASAFRQAIHQARAPLVLFIAIWGFYCAFSIGLFRFDSSTGALLAGLVWLRTAALVIDLFWFLFRLINVLEGELLGWAAKTAHKWDDIFLAVGFRAARLILPLLAILLIVPALDLPPRWHGVLQDAASVLLIGFGGYILCELAQTAEKTIQAEYKVDIADNLATRKIQTQAGILKKIFIALVVLVTVACMLTVFAPVRSLGRSLLASAGVAGIVLGIAAQRSLGTLLAGIQIAFSQPIRLDDVVIVEGEWGRVEEITLTYVVVAIWDLRRMVLPITYFIEKPFQNWTRSSAALLGTVFLYLDYTAPLAELRAELERILAASPLWDKKVKGLQVTDAKDNVLEIRILASAANSSVAFDLRCEIREKLVDFLQRKFPGALPRSRGTLEIARLTREEAKPAAPGEPPQVLSRPDGMISPVAPGPPRG